MELNKEEFLKTELGTELKKTIEAFVYTHSMREDCFDKGYWEDFKHYGNRLYDLLDSLTIFKVAIKQFYGIEYFFDRTDNYFGICTKDGSDWLFKVEWKIDGKGE